ncbi:unnamed protein product, partial [Symbiodinium pilosum]
MRELNFQGDSKLVWASAPVTPVQWSHDFARPDLEALFSKVLQTNLDMEGEAEGEELRVWTSEDALVDVADDGDAVEVAAEELEQGRAEDQDVANAAESISFVELPVLASEGLDMDELLAACRLVADEDPRLSSASEERLRLASEDVRRQQDLQESGAVSTSRLVAAAGAAAAGAVSSTVSLSQAWELGASEPVAGGLPDIPLFSDLQESLDSGPDEEAMSAVGRLLAECSTDELPTPTTSVDARIVMSDSSQRQAWLQTNVVDSPQKRVLGEEFGPLLVLEIWVLQERTCTSLLLSQVNCAHIVDVRQHGSLSASDLAFEILFTSGADLLQVDPKSLAIAKTAGAKEGQRQRPSDLRERLLLDNDVWQQTSIFNVLPEESPAPKIAPGLAGQQLSLQCTFAHAPSWSRLE